jgi:hypothetical protein
VINFINNNGGSVAAENLSHPDPTGRFALVANNFSAECSLFVAASLDFSTHESAESISLLQLQRHSGSGTSSAAVVNLTDSML